MRNAAIKTLSMWALALLTLFCSTLQAGPSLPSVKRLEEANSIKDSFETPHTKWAKPYAGGPIRVLFITPLSAETNVLPLRGPVEIMQRFDIEADAVLVLPSKGTTYAVAYAGGSGLYGGQLGDERLARLLKNKYDCYVVTAGSALGNIPPEARKTILKRVKQDGAGLVFLYKLGEDDKSIIAKARELRQLPEMRSGQRSEGPTNNFETGVRPFWPSLLVISERELNAPVLAASGDVAKRGQIFQLVATIPEAQGMHSLKLRAVGPDGKDAPWFSRSVVVEDGTAKIELPIAYNEQAGNWTFTATDLYTGVSAVSSFIVE